MMLTRSTSLTLAVNAPGLGLAMTPRAYNVLMRELSTLATYPDGEIKARRDPTVGDVLDVSPMALLDFRSLGTDARREIMRWRLQARVLLDPVPDLTDTAAVRSWLNATQE